MPGDAWQCKTELVHLRASARTSNLSGELNGPSKTAPPRSTTTSATVKASTGDFHCMVMGQPVLVKNQDQNSLLRMFIVRLYNMVWDPLARLSSLPTHPFLLWQAWWEVYKPSYGGIKQEKNIISHQLKER